MARVDSEEYLEGLAQRLREAFPQALDGEGRVNLKELLPE